MAACEKLPTDNLNNFRSVCSAHSATRSFCIQVHLLMHIFNGLCSFLHCRIIYRVFFFFFGFKLDIWSSSWPGSVSTKTQTRWLLATWPLFSVPTCCGRTLSRECLTVSLLTLTLYDILLLHGCTGAATFFFCQCFFPGTWRRWWPPCPFRLWAWSSPSSSMLIGSSLEVGSDSWRCAVGSSRPVSKKK